MRFATGLALGVMLVGGLAATSSAKADLYLVGAYLFDADSAGRTTNGNYQYDTNLNDPNVSTLFINGSGKSLGLALSGGDNNFTFDGENHFTLPHTGDLGLWFDTTNTPYNPPGPGGSARTPDLLVARASDGTTAFFTPAVGTLINNYAYAGTAAANGLTSFILGADTVSVTAFSVASTPDGTFTLHVGSQATDTPEPGSFGLLAGLVVSGGVFALRRRAFQMKCITDDE